MREYKTVTVASTYAAVKKAVGDGTIKSVNYISGKPPKFKVEYYTEREVIEDIDTFPKMRGNKTAKNAEE